MDIALKPAYCVSEWGGEKSFNPSCNGYSSKACARAIKTIGDIGFNPSCNGYSSKAILETALLPSA